MNLLLAALEFPPISHLIEWPNFGGGTGLFAVNKVIFLMILSTIITLAIFLLAGSRGSLVPTGIQNVAEMSVDFIREQIVLQTMGEEGLHKKWIMPFLTTLFWFILLNNIWGIIPVAQMPVNARMAMPAMLSWSAKRSPTLLMAAALGGFLVRMVLLLVAVALVKNQSWFEAVPLGITVLVTHVGLLVWEARHVSLSLAYPGLKPRRTGA